VNKLRFVYVILAALALSGCQTAAPPQIETFAAPVIPQSQPLTLKDVKWKVYNTAELKRVIAEQEKKGNKDFVVYALDGKNFQANASNMTDIERYIKEQGAVILYLKNTLKARETKSQS
jgi:hypothetical protein